MKTCTRCKARLDRAAFYQDRSRPDGHTNRCKACILELRRTPEGRAKRRQEKVRARARGLLARLQVMEPPLTTAEKHRKRTYGLSPTAFQAMVEAQDGRCGICPRPIQVVDHDHETGQVRGLLCSNCNSGIGMLRDDPELLLAAVRYLSPGTVIQAVGHRPCSISHARRSPWFGQNSRTIPGSPEGRGMATGNTPG